jgi:hypothetical protein
VGIEASPILRLQVLLRIEVCVVDDDRVGGRQRDAQASSPCAQQEAEALRILGELPQTLLPILWAHACVYPWARARARMHTCDAILCAEHHKTAAVIFIWICV